MPGHVSKASHRRATRPQIDEGDIVKAQLISESMHGLSAPVSPKSPKKVPQKPLSRVHEICSFDTLPVRTQQFECAKFKCRIVFCSGLLIHVSSRQANRQYPLNEIWRRVGHPSKSEECGLSDHVPISNHPLEKAIRGSRSRGHLDAHSANLEEAARVR